MSKEKRCDNCIHFKLCRYIERFDSSLSSTIHEMPRTTFDAFPCMYFPGEGAKWQGKVYKSLHTKLVDLFLFTLWEETASICKEYVPKSKPTGEPKCPN